MQLIISLVFVFVIGFIFAHLWEYFTAKILKVSHLADIKGLHFHHSVFGLAGLGIAVFFIGNWFRFFSMISFSTGIILQHSLTPDGFVFVTKNKLS